MPTHRIQKSRSPDSVPDLGNPDRKRVLNVLAQRRYRQKRKEKITKLEAQAKSLEHLVDQQSSSSDDIPPQRSSSTSENSGSVEDILGVSYGDEDSDFVIHGNPFDTSLMEELECTFPATHPLVATASPPSAFPVLPTPLTSTSGFVDVQRSPSSPSLAFPLTADGGTLSIPIMGAIQAFMSIATALDLTDNLWDPSYMHVMPASASYASFLPPNLRPISAQLMVPHHPAIDLMPWPTMREKLILMLSMPSALRPPVAREDDDNDGSSGFGVWSSPSHKFGQSRAITQLVQDLDDLQDGGGIRVHGNSVAWGQGNEFIEEAWEIGESFYRKWWFCLDQRIVDQSNVRRKERGLGKMRLTA